MGDVERQQLEEEIMEKNKIIQQLTSEKDLLQNQLNELLCAKTEVLKDSSKEEEKSTNNIRRKKGYKSRIFDHHFLSSTNALYDEHMGVENMAPLLYSLIRFLKPTKVLEIGAGYTSVFILQALADNFHELSEYTNLFNNRNQLEPAIKEKEWLVEGYILEQKEPKLVCIDNMTHGHTTAPQVVEVADDLNLSQFLSLRVGDAWKMTEYLASNDAPFDMLWLDFGVGSKWEDFLALYWPMLSSGGICVIHSTLTNRMTRLWLEQMRTGRDDPDHPLGEFSEWSALEPHKRMQNSFTVLQKRSEDFSEPIYSIYP